MSVREAKFYIITGTQGTGKSHLLKDLCEGNDRNLILPANALDEAWANYPTIKAEFEWVDDPNKFGNSKMKRWYIPELHTFTGIRVLDLHSIETDQEAIEIFKAIASTTSGMMRGALIIDDYKNWIITQGNLPMFVRRLFGDRRHRELDIFIASHSFQDMNAELMKFNPSLVVFKTTLPPNETVAKKIRNFDTLIETIDRVNAIADEGIRTGNKTKKHYAELFEIS